MSEISDLEAYFKMQFEQLKYICESESPWIFLCLAAFMDYLSLIPDTRPAGKYQFNDMLTYRYPPAYANFKYARGDQDLPKQMHLTLRNGLVHRFSLMPNKRGLQDGARPRSLYLAHRSSGLKHLDYYIDATDGIDAAILIAEDLLQDTQDFVADLIERATNDSVPQQRIVHFLRENPPVAGTEQPFFWLPK